MNKSLQHPGLAAPMLNYGSKTWSLRKADKKRIEAAELAKIPCWFHLPLFYQELNDPCRNVTPSQKFSTSQGRVSLCESLPPSPYLTNFSLSQGRLFPHLSPALMNFSQPYGRIFLSVLFLLSLSFPYSRICPSPRVSFSSLLEEVSIAIRTFAVSGTWIRHSFQKKVVLVKSFHNVSYQLLEN